MVLRIEQGIGMKDRYVMLFPKLLEILPEWWRVGTVLKAYQRGRRGMKKSRDRPVMVCLPYPDARNDQHGERNWTMGHRMTHLEFPPKGR
jgi:hypothetical protein